MISSFHLPWTHRSIYRSIGWPMIQAGISTVLSVLPLLFVSAYMVDVFIKTVLLVIALGLIHGVVFLPAFLLTTDRNYKHCLPSLCLAKVAKVSKSETADDMGKSDSTSTMRNDRGGSRRSSISCGYASFSSQEGSPSRSPRRCGSIHLKVRVCADRTDKIARRRRSI